MSRYIDVKNCSKEELKKMDTELTIELEVSKYNKHATPETISLFRLENNILYIPFAYSKKIKRPDASNFEKKNIEFCLTLRPEQQTVCSEAIKILNKNSSVIVACPVGFGKTYSAIYLSSAIKLPTLILCHRLVLLKQWEEAIKECSPLSTYQIVTPSSKIKSADFYIVNASNVYKFSTDFLKTIGFLIVDECHLILAKTLSKSLLHVHPRFVVALSGTPYREDGLNILFDMYFGKEKIERKLYREHTVFEVKTDFVPDVELSKNGRINWGSLLESQANSVERNELIIKIIQRFPDRIILVLCKRISQAEYLFRRLQEEKEDVSDLFGSKQEFNKESRILIGTTGKCATGFNHPRLDTLLLASDLESYFIQALGRIFRTKATDNLPIVFDLIDTHPILKKHWLTRRNVYLEHGGKIEKLKI